MKEFNVIVYDFNRQIFKPYNVMPYFVRTYKETIENHKNYPDSNYFKIPKTFEEFKKFVNDNSLYQFWGRCEYEIILFDWPNEKHYEKWDVHEQIKMNLDLVTKIFMENVKDI